MESPNKKKLRSGVRSTVGGSLGGSTYKTASPYNIKTINMANGLSPLMQAAVGGEVKTIAGQNIIKGEGEDEGNFYYETIDGEQIFIEDPDGVIAKNVTDGMVSDLDFSFEETEDGYYKVTGVAGEGGEQQASPEDSTPQGPMVPGGMGMPEGGM